MGPSGQTSETMRIYRQLAMGAELGYPYLAYGDSDSAERSISLCVQAVDAMMG
jgi:hypothetical protein